MFHLLLLILSLNLTARNAVAIDADTGEILYSKAIHEKVFPASTTKIATCLYGLKKCKNLNQVITADQESIGLISEKQKRKPHLYPAWWLEKGGTHIGIKAGEQLTIKDLFKGMMIASGGDASNILAKTISGSISQFMEEMNLYLKEIGCKNTTFVNPHGRHHPDHKTTAYDLAIMTKKGLQYPLFREIVSSTSFSRPTTNKQLAAHYTQTNKLLKKGQYFYQGAIGVKTGFHSLAGHCLVAAAERKGKTIITVVLGSESSHKKFEETKALLDAAFREKERKSKKRL